MHLRSGIALFSLLAQAAGLSAQSPAAGAAAATITAADVRRRVGILADDSMQGRNTPSEGLTKAALYVASQFKAFGLKPGGDHGGWLQQYPISTRRILADRSVVSFGQEGGERGARIAFADGAAWAGAELQSGEWKGQVVLVAGAGRLDSLPDTGLAGNIVVFVADWTRPGAPQRLSQLTRRARAAGARGVVAVVNSDSVYAARYAPAARRIYEVVGRPSGGFFSVALREGAVTAQVPEAAEQFATLREAPAPVVQPMPDWQGTLTVQDTVLTLAYAPNTVGILEGSDPTLKQEYLVFSAHMDHIGKAGAPGAACRAVGADSICNGADDDASGTASVIELAEAFSRLKVRPKRSIIFLTVSGEEHGLWGSEWFVNNPPVDIRQIVANFNSDMLGRNWRDTIVAIGKEHSDLGSTLNRVNAAHPELNMVAIDDRWPAESFYTRSDHYNFALKGVPVLFFFNGVHADYHRVSDTPDKIDAEKESRIIKLFFWVGLEVANAASRPRWVPASYQQIVNP